MRLLIAIALLLVLAACNKTVKPDLPGAGTIVKPEIVQVVRKVYVPIPDALTQEQPIAEGPLAQCPSVAAQRKASLRKANGQLRQIHAVQGTEVQP